MALETDSKVSSRSQAASPQTLCALQEPDGGWPYFAGGQSAIEPTAIAVAALWALARRDAARADGIEFLQSMRTPAGGLRPQPGQHEPTALAAMAGIVMATCGGERRAAERIADDLTSWSTRTVNVKGIYDHDMSLRGFAWTPDTHSWVEPTAYAVILHETLGRGRDPRVAEGRRLLVDRAVPGGGWNYGNPRVFGAVLEPDPFTSAIALLALLDDPSRECVRLGVQYLRRCAPTLPSPLTRAWAAMALRACAADVPDPLGPIAPLFATSFLAADSPWHHAAALLAAAPLDRNPFVMWSRQ